MTDSVDMDALAQRYIDMWQEQLAQISTDPAVTEAWGSALQNTAQSLGWTPDAISAFAATLQGAANPSSNRSAGPTGTEAAAPAPGGGGDDPTAMLRRLNALERRLAALEADREGD